MADIDVSDRKVIHAGKVFIKAGEENNRAYMIQQGCVLSFIKEDGQKIEVARHGPGTVIGETCLALDEPIKMSYETLVDTTVITITRQDFEKKLSRADKTVVNVFGQVMSKLNAQDTVAIAKASENARVDGDALKIVQNLIGDLPQQKKAKYEKAILPHLNNLIKEIKNLKKG